MKIISFKKLFLIFAAGLLVVITAIKLKPNISNEQMGNKQIGNEQVDNQQPISSTISGWVIETNENELILQEGAFEAPGELYKLTISDDTIIYNNPKSMQKVDIQISAGKYIEAAYTHNTVDTTLNPIKIDEVISIIMHLSEGLILEGEVVDVSEYAIKVKSGVTYTVTVSEDTVIYKEDSEIELSSIQIGQHVRVLYKGGISMTAPPSVSEVAKIVVR